MPLLKNKVEFFQCIQKFEYIPFTQTEGWYNFNECDRPGRVLFFADKAEQPCIACFGHIKQKAGFKMLLIEGECLRYKEYNSKLIASFYREILTLGYDVIEVNSLLKYSPVYEIGIRQAGLLRPVGLFSMHLSKWIDLTKPVQYNSNWKRNIKNSLSNQLNLLPVFSPGRQNAERFVSLYQELRKEKGLNHQLSVSQIERLLAAKEFKLFAVTDEKGEWVSAIIIHLVQKHGGLLYACKNSKAAETGATFFMYDNLFAWLAQQGIETFDMEKLLPSTHSTEGVFLFKEGIRGEHTIYCGEWSWYSKSYLRPLMYFVKKYLFKRVEV